MQAVQWLFGDQVPVMHKLQNAHAFHMLTELRVKCRYIQECFYEVWVCCYLFLLILKEVLHGCLLGSNLLLCIQYQEGLMLTYTCLSCSV